MTRASQLTTLLTLAAALAANAANAPLTAQETASPDALTVEARGIVKSFAGELLTTLQAAMKDGGTVGGMAACNVAAPTIAADAAKRSGWSVGRTALKVRNRANAPDAFEYKALQEFLTAAKAGDDLAKLERLETVTENGKRTIRYMKAIPTAEPCLACHGSDLKPETAQAIADLYPADQANGFALGDLRGAFTLKRALN